MLTENIKLDPKQMEAVSMCVDGSFRIAAVTGPAGSGKTTIIKTVVEKMQENGLIIRIAAPTGKAARRITDITGLKAVTIHKLLEYPLPGERDPETGKVLEPGSPKRNYQCPLVGDVVLVDEYAMVNNELDRNLIDALPRGCRLLVFGDISQLPPIEPHQIKTEGGTPFEQHLQRKSITLDTVHRQGADAGILHSANLIRKGIMPKKYDDFEFVFTEQPVKYLERYVDNALDAGVDFSKLENQVICAEKKSWVGTGPLNRLLQDFFNGERVAEEGLSLPREKWDTIEVQIAVGDKIVCTSNTYDMRNYHERYEQFNEREVGIYSTFIPTPDSAMMLNGETGVIVAIDIDGSIEADFGDRVVHIPSQYVEYNNYNDSFYNKDPRKGIDLAYALTTHKCQGSEFSRVIYVINKSKPFMLNRKNFYTAVTRAKDHVMVICDQASLRYALRPFVNFKPKGK
jgi:exodeoxyribonuclease V alpha subunit